MNSQVT